MSIEGQGHSFTIYFPGFVLYLDKISGERLQDHWSSGLFVVLVQRFPLPLGAPSRGCHLIVAHPETSIYLFTVEYVCNTK